MNKQWYLLMCLIIGGFTVSMSSHADSQLIDKIYHPYVLANEREVEWRYFIRHNNKGNALAQRLGYGFSIYDNVTFEAYVIGDKKTQSDFNVHAYEGEFRWMLTEQGKYSIDTGLLFEFERDTLNNTWEITTGLLAEKEFEKTSLTTNIFLVYGIGSNIEQELSTTVRAQYRYRLTPELQPAIEFYANDDYVGIGPAFMGTQRFTPFKRLKWETAFVFSSKHGNQDNTFRLSIEYEF